MVIELLTTAVRSDESIKGIPIGKTIVKLILYADDLTAAVEDVSSARKLLRLIKQFSLFSGLKLNVEKN